MSETPGQPERRLPDFVVPDRYMPITINQPDGTAHQAHAGARWDHLHYIGPLDQWILKVITERGVSEVFLDTENAERIIGATDIRPYVRNTITESEYALYMDIQASTLEQQFGDEFPEGFGDTIE